MSPDFVFTVGSLILAASLLPAVLAKDTTVPLSTSVPTALVITVHAFTFAHMRFAFSAITSCLAACCWFILVYRAAARP